MKPALAAAVLALLAAGCAPQSPPPERQMVGADGRLAQCFHANNVNGFRSVNRETVDLTVGPDRVYRVELFGLCPDMDQAMALGVRTRGGSSWVCEGQDIEVIVPMEGIGPRRCPGRSVRMLTQAELEASKRR